MEWATPKDLFQKLSDQYGPFELDVAATKENALCPNFITKEWDGLKTSWAGYSKIWMNCPYGRGVSGKWVEKAFNEAKTNVSTVVALLPARTDTRFFHRFIYPFAGPNSARPEYAWAAGIIDGEGCIHIAKSEGAQTVCHALRVKVKMTHQPTIQRLGQIFHGGYFAVEDKKPEGHKTAYVWTISGPRAAEVLRLVYPFMITKRAEAFAALEFLTLESGQRGRKGLSPALLKKREHYYELLKNLKKDSTLINPLRVEIHYLEGRLKFGGAKHGAPFPSMVVVFNGKGMPK